MFNSFAFFEKRAYTKKEKNQQKMREEFEMTCADVSGNMVRCENKEVICYGSNGDFTSNDIIGEAGASCKFK